MSDILEVHAAMTLRSEIEHRVVRALAHYGDMDDADLERLIGDGWDQAVKSLAERSVISRRGPVVGDWGLDSQPHKTAALATEPPTCTPQRWSTDEQDESHLVHTSIDEALYEHVDNACGHGGTAPVGTVIQVTGWARICIGINAADHVASHLLEYLDEEYGDPDDHYTPVSNDILRDAAEFLRKTASRYHVWRCEPVVRVKVRIDQFDGDDLKWTELARDHVWPTKANAQ